MYRKIVITLLTITVTVGVRYCAGNQFNTPQSTDSSSFTTSVTNTKFTPRKQAPVTFEKQSRVVIKHLYEGKYDEIENVLNEAIDNSYITRGGTYYAISVLRTGFNDYAPYFDQNWINAFDSWIKQSPDSSLAYTTRAMFYYRYGWEIRGTNSANETPKNVMEKYHYYLSLSIEDTQKALQLDANNPILLSHILTVGASTGMPREQFEEYFRQANNEFSYMAYNYRQKARYLDPNWYGSEVELLTFAREAVENAPRKTLIPLILVQAHERLSTFYPDRKAYYNRPEVWTEIEENYQKVLTDFPQAGMYAMQYARTARKAGKDDLSRKYAHLALKREPNNPIIQQMAVKMGIIEK